MADELDDLLDGYFGKDSRPAAVPAVPLGADRNLDTLFDAHFGAERPVAKPGAVAPAEGGDPAAWGPLSHFVSALTMGLGPQAAGALVSPLNPGPVAERIAADRDAWMKEHPTQGLQLDVMGNIVPALTAAILGQEYIAAPLAVRIATMAPRVAPAIDFLSGSAGAYGRGIVPSATRVASSATRGAIEGAFGGAVQAPAGEGSLLDQVKTGAEVGSIVGPLGNLLIIHGSNISPEVAASTRRAMDLGLPMQAGKLPGAAPGLTLLDRLFTSKASGEVQRGAFANAVGREVGVPTERITQKWVQEADNVNGGTMGRVAAAHSIPGNDPRLASDFAHAEGAAKGAMDTEQYKKFSGLLDDLKSEFAVGDVPGEVYKRWTGYGGKLYSFSKDPAMKPYIYGGFDSAGHPIPNVRDVLDNAWERAIASSGTPEDVQAWQSARRGYRITRAIDKDVNEAGEYNPHNLLKRIQQSFGNAMKAGDIGDIATAGQFIYKPDVPAAKQGSVLYRHPLATIGAAASVPALAEHYAGPAGEHLLNLWHNPHEAVLPAMGIAAAAAGGKAANAWFNSQTYTRHLLDIAQGRTAPWLHGMNPAILATEDLYNARQ
jgi:hypothetical protein